MCSGCLVGRHQIGYTTQAWRVTQEMAVLPATFVSWNCSVCRNCSWSGSEMEQNKEEFFLAHKRECLLEEYKALSSELQSESNISMSIKNWCITVWVISFGLAYQSKVSPLLGASAIIIMILAFWLVNVFYSYYGVIRRKRFNQVCTWLNQLPFADVEKLQQWQTPANPFEGIPTRVKLKTVLRAALSPAISTVYLSLIVVTTALSLVLPRLP